MMKVIVDITYTMTIKCPVCGKISKWVECKRPNILISTRCHHCNTILYNRESEKNK